MKHPGMRRHFLLLAVIALVVLGHAAVGASLFLSPDRWRGATERALERELGLPARVSAVDVIGMDHMQIRGLIIGTPELPRSQEAFFRIGAVDVEADVLSLLRKRGGVKSVAISGCEGRITRALLDRFGKRREAFRRSRALGALSLADGDVSFVAGALYDDSPAVSLTGIQAEVRATSNIAAEYALRVSLHHEVVNELRTEARVNLTTGDFTAHVECLGLKLGDELQRLLPASAGKPWEQLRPGGLGNLDLQVVGNLARREFRAPEGSISLSGAEMTHHLFPYRVPDIVGKASWHGDTMTLENLLGHSQDSIIEITGQISSIASGARPMLRITANDVPLDDRVRNALQEPARLVWDRFKPRGKMDVTSYVLPLENGGENKREGENGGKIDVRVVCRASGVTTTYERLPLEISDLTGNVVITRDLFTMRGLQGTCLGQPVAIDGEVGWNTKKAVRSLHIEGQHFPLNEEFRRAMPEGVRKAMIDLDAAGHVTFEVDVLFSGSEDRSSPTAATFKGKAFLEDGALTERWPIEAIHGETEFSGTVPKNGPPHVEIRVARARATVKGFDLSEVSGSIILDEHTVKLADFRAEFCGGQITGSVKFPGSEGGLADGALDFRRIDLQEMLLSARMKEARMTGLMKGTFDMPAKLPNGKPAVAVVDVGISQGDLYRIPPLLKLFDLLNLTGGSEQVITDARMILYLRQNEIVLQQMRLTGADAIPIFGQGTIEYDGSLDLRFITGRGKGFVGEFLGKLPLVGAGVDFVDSMIDKFTKVILSSVVQVNVSGSFAKPKGSITTFSKVTPEMRDFIMEAQKELSPRLRSEGAAAESGPPSGPETPAEGNTEAP